MQVRLSLCPQPRWPPQTPHPSAALPPRSAAVACAPAATEDPGPPWVNLFGIFCSPKSAAEIPAASSRITTVRRAAPDMLPPPPSLGQVLEVLEIQIQIRAFSPPLQHKRPVQTAFRILRGFWGLNSASALLPCRLVEQGPRKRRRRSGTVEGEVLSRTRVPAARPEGLESAQKG